MKALKNIERKYYKYASPSSGYRELSYLYAPAGSYIDTNFIPNSNSKIDCKMAWTTSATNNMAFGAGINYNNSNIELYSSGASFEVHYSANAIIGSYTPYSYFRFVQDKGNIVIYNEDGSQNSTYNFGTKTFDCVYTMDIFALHRNTIITSSYPNYLQYFKIYDNDILTRDYIPVERMSDGVLGLYDKVNSVFYTNLGSGEFTKGEYIIEEGTSSDYDFYKDIDIYNGTSEIIRQYFDQLEFSYHPNIQTWEVPSGISKIHVVCAGSAGFGTNAGFGGMVECDLDVSNIETLYMVVGGIPTDYYNPQYGASDIRTDNTGILDTTSLQSRLIVAGAGGCTCWGGHGPSAGGAGGGIIAGAGGNTTGANGGGGGTQSAGGAGGAGGKGYGITGTFGLGGASAYYGSSPVSGAGGAGWYGGGSGGWHAGNKRWFYAGGGGGSSYPEQDNQLCENIVHTQGNNSGNGYIIISTLNGEHFYKDITEYKAFKI